MLLLAVGDSDGEEELRRNDPERRPDRAIGAAPGTTRAVRPKVA